MDEKEIERINTFFRLVSLTALGVLGTGVVFYHIVEKLNWIDSLYFSVITLTTVGYGDITPHTNLGKIFTVFYVLIGIAIIGTFANLMLKRTYVRRKDAHDKRKHKHDV